MATLIPISLIKGSKIPNKYIVKDPNQSNAKSFNLDAYIADNAGGGGSTELEVLSTYPTTDATKVGQKFIYKGNEWKYHSQAELDDLGWTSVSEGFPAPVSKNINFNILYNGADSTFTNTQIYFGGDNIILDFLGFGDPTKTKRILYQPIAGFPTTTISEIKNANLLISLEDIGTTRSFYMLNLGLSESTINDLFTQLPTTTKTATIDVRNNPGSATCDPTIATSKGYIVVT